MAFQSKMKSMAPRRVQFQKRIRLISGGYSKPDAFPDGEITVFPWDANIDDWLSERVRKGDRNTVLFDLCGKLCDLNGCPINLFVMGDVNTVLLVSRSLRFSGVVEYECQCPSCQNITRESIMVPDELGKVGEKAVGYPGFDLITLPECQDEVGIRPLLVGDEIAILNRESASKALVTDTILHIVAPVVSINGGKPDSQEDVLRWYQALSPGDAQELEDKENQLYPHLDSNLPHVCDQCRTRFKHKLDFTSEFFRPSLKPGNRTAVAPDVRPSLERKGAGNQPQGSAGPVPGPHGGVGQR